MKNNNLLAVILAVFIPPLGVFLKKGVCGHLFLNIILTLLGWLPGILHALYVIVADD